MTCFRSYIVFVIFRLEIIGFALRLMSRAGFDLFFPDLKLDKQKASTLPQSLSRGGDGMVLPTGSTLLSLAVHGPVRVCPVLTEPELFQRALLVQFDN
jgi:hypothetical protein